ncbi:hypothetical protein HOE31_02635 [bacterium]|jgi:hypothetical protein|nr:hypothetical protein [bacterium]MBT4335313.1 hypothetical protein [bacterium]MBT4495399.1 hypothetical protein [bacterium]MBT4763624.1 hypothetical protein [bacterium]MBT5400996.1 hypothetical protein [bacterium]
MDKEIKNILNDLYKIDKSFKKHESELIKTINELINNKPKIIINKDFREELKSKLIKQAKKLNKTKIKKLNLNFMKLRNYYYVFGSFAIIILIVISSVYYSNQTSNLAFGLNIESVSENAFGSIENNLSANETVDRQALGIGAGGGGGYATASSEMATKSDTAVSMIAPDYMNNFQYIYEGDEITISENEMAVLKKSKNINNLNLSSIINNFNFETVNLNKFSDAKVQNISFAQEKDFGYQVYLNFLEGQVSLNQNYSTWPQNNEHGCIGDVCTIEIQQRTSISDVPENQALINIANDFLNEYDIDTSLYGEPEVDNRWKIYYEQSKDKASYYIPEVINVLYPLKINNQIVYNEGGNKEGLNLAIHIKYKKVYSLHNLTSQNYQSSMYKTETDINKILDIARRGGRNVYTYQNNQKVIEVKIGTPTLSYVKIWQYNNNQNDELLVPAFIFPILEKPAVNYFYKDNIIVPLISDMLDSDNNPRVMPMPLVEPAIMEN